MRIPRRVSLAVAIIAAAYGDAQAQAADSLMRAGARMRVFVVDTVPESGEVRYSYPVGVLVQLRPGELALRDVSDRRRSGPAIDLWSVPVSKIGLAEVYAGKRRHAVHGGIAGVVLGGLAGVLAGTVGGPENVQRACSPGETVCTSRLSEGPSDSRAARALTYGGVAAVTGAIIGYFIQTERWQVINLTGGR